MENVNETNEMLRRAEEQGALVGWLRTYDGFSCTSPTIPECIERFPGLDRFQVDQAIRQVREEQREPDGPWAKASDEALHFYLRLGWQICDLEVQFRETRALPKRLRAEVIRLLLPANRKIIRKYLRGERGA